MRQKMKLLAILLADPRFIARDNEGADGDDQHSDGDDGAGADISNAKFTAEQQALVNDIVVKRVKKVRSQLEQTERRYETLLQSQSLTANEKSELQSELEQVQAQLRTREQQTTYEAKKRETEFGKKLEETTNEANRYRSLFETQTRDNSILSAASQHGAYNPEQFISVLGPRTEIVAETNEQGEQTGRYVPRVKVQKKAEDGTVSEVYVTTEEAIEDMKQDVAKYGNLFRGNVAKGIGEGSNTSFAGKSRVDVGKMTDEEYFANRDAIKKQYGIRERRGF